MVKVEVVLNDKSYSLSYKGIKKSIEMNMLHFFSGLELFEEEVSLITPDSFNTFHQDFFLEMKSRMTFLEKLKLRVFGTTVLVELKNDALLDDLILRTLSGLFEHLVRARIIHFIFNGKKINSLKFIYSIELLSQRYAKTKNEDLRIRSNIFNVDKYYKKLD